VLKSLVRLTARAYWQANRPFIAAFAESLLGYGEGALTVDGKVIVARLDRFLSTVNTPVFLQFMATLALLPLYAPPNWPRAGLKHSLMKVWYFFKSLFAHGHFLASSREKRAAWIEEMYQRLIRDAPEQEDDTVKTITTLGLFKFTLVSAYLDNPKLWPALDYVPFQNREWNPPSGPNLENPPQTESSKLLHERRQTPAQVAVKPVGRLTYCVIGSGAGGAVAARTIQEENPNARVILLEVGPLVTNDLFRTSALDSLSKLYMNAAITLSKDQQFMFQQGRCVGGSTVINNSVAFRPEGFWWEDLKRRWQNLGIKLDFTDLDRQFDVLTKRLHIAPVDERVITTGARTVREGFAKLVAGGIGPDTAYDRVLPPITVASNVINCVGCGRCNLGCQYDAKQSTLVAFIPDFVRNGGLLVPDAKVTALEFGAGGPLSSNQQVRAVCVETDTGTTRIEADRFILAAGAYASSKLLWRSGFLGAVPGVRTVGKKFSVNVGTPVVGLFPGRQDAFLGQQVGYAVEIPEERMIIETAFAPPGLVALGLPAWGPEFQRRLRRITHMITATPVFGTLAYGEIKKGLLGDSGFVIDFKLIDEDWRRLAKGMKIAAHAMFKMGAEEIFISRLNASVARREEDLDDYFAGIDESDFITVLSAHMQGGNAMAARPYDGVVDRDMKVFGVDNLWICDASVIPSPITVNIALTVMALSRYASQRIAAAA
jgi:choline dehydrogenase-like flavoprotein